MCSLLSVCCLCLFFVAGRGLILLIDRCVLFLVRRSLHVVCCVLIVAGCSLCFCLLFVV